MPHYRNYCRRFGWEAALPVKISMHKSVFFLTSKSISTANELKLDSAIFGETGLNFDEVDEIRKVLGGTKIYVEVATFACAKYQAQFPDAQVVEATGKQAVGVCPTHLGVREEILNSVAKVLKLGIDGVWLNYLRYPTDWQSSNPDILDTCYCDRCIKNFEEFIGEPVKADTLEDLALLIDGAYYHEWLEFKAKNIVSFVKEVKELISLGENNVQLGLFAVPWEDKEFGAGIKRVVAQDFGKLADYVDIFSPMLYHKKCGQNVSWIKQKVDYFWNLGGPFLPLVQTEASPNAISADEFANALEFAVAKPSLGVCLYSFEELANQPELLAAATRFFAK